MFDNILLEDLVPISIPDRIKYLGNIHKNVPEQISLFSIRFSTISIVRGT